MNVFTDPKFLGLLVAGFTSILKAWIDTRKSKVPDDGATKNEGQGMRRTLNTSFVLLAAAILSLGFSLWLFGKESLDQTKRQTALLNRILYGQLLSARSLIIDLKYDVDLDPAAASRLRDILFPGKTGSGSMSQQLRVDSLNKIATADLETSMLLDPSGMFDVLRGNDFNTLIGSQSFSLSHALNSPGATSDIILDGNRASIEITGMPLGRERGDPLPLLSEWAGATVSLVFTTRSPSFTVRELRIRTESGLYLTTLKEFAVTAAPEERAFRLRIPTELDPQVE